MSVQLATSLVLISLLNAAISSRAVVRIACVGDSITAGAHSSNRATKSYPAVLQRLLDPHLYAVENLGSSGATVQATKNAYAKRPPYKTLVSGTWDVVVIMLGTNDARDRGSGGSEFWKDDCGAPPDFDLDGCSFARDYAKLIEVVRTRGRSDDEPPEIFLAIPAPLMKAKSNRANQTVVNTVFPLLIPAIAHANGLRNPPISVFSALGGVADWKERFPASCTQDAVWPGCSFFCDSKSCDNCHPSNDGYAAIARAVKSAIVATLTNITEGAGYPSSSLPPPMQTALQEPSPPSSSPSPTAIALAPRAPVPEVAHEPATSGMQPASVMGEAAETAEQEDSEPLPIEA